MLHDQHLQKRFWTRTILYSHEYMGQDFGHWSSTSAQRPFRQSQLAGDCAGLRGRRTLLSHHWCLRAPPNGCSLSSWLVLASSQHGAVRKAGLHIGSRLPGGIDINCRLVKVETGKFHEVTSAMYYWSNRDWGHPRF